MCLANISSYLFESGGFIVICVIEKDGAFSVIKAFGENLNQPKLSSHEVGLISN